MMMVVWYADRQHHSERLGISKAELMKKRYMEINETIAVRSWECLCCAIAPTDVSLYFDLLLSYIRKVGLYFKRDDGIE